MTALTLTALTGLALTAKPAQAQVVTFTGVDAGARPGNPSPLSNAAAASFDSAATLLGPESLINFESAPLGSVSGLTIAPGVTLSQTGGASFIGNNPQGPPTSVYGFNTTSGGSNFIDQEGATVTFTFATPIQGFGAYFTGVQDFGTENLTFSDGTSQTVPLIVPANNAGGIEFVGFTDTGKSISSITVNGAADSLGIDDVRFIGPAAVTATPEPASYAAFAMGGFGLLGLSLKARKRTV